MIVEAIGLYRSVDIVRIDGRFWMSLNIGKYAHFADRYGDLTLDYYVFPRGFGQGQTSICASEGKGDFEVTTDLYYINVSKQ